MQTNNGNFDVTFSWRFQRHTEHAFGKKKFSRGFSKNTFVPIDGSSVNFPRARVEKTKKRDSSTSTLAAPSAILSKKEGLSNHVYVLHFPHSNLLAQSSSFFCLISTYIERAFSEIQTIGESHAPELHLFRRNCSCPSLTEAGCNNNNGGGGGGGGDRKRGGKGGWGKQAQSDGRPREEKEREGVMEKEEDNEDAFALLIFYNATKWGGEVCLSMPRR